MKSDKNENQKSLVLWGRETLEAEASAIRSASEKLGAVFSEAAQLILGCEGRLVTTGIGKSGHIAKKVSATFASTGTPAFFIHPSEALHGDFGMIHKSDCLLAFAYGGESTEVVEVANYARRLGVKIIAITGKVTSSLAKASHCVLDGSVEREACPLGLAPTSSSTVALALGDALAVSVMRARGFREEDFASLHPGGVLGRRLSIVREHMRTNKEFRSLSMTSSFSQILEAITNPNFGIVAILNEKLELVGAITDGDIRRALVKFGDSVVSKKAGDLMSKNPKTIEDTALAVDAVVRMEEAKITSLFVKSSEQTSHAVGLVRMQDLIEAKVV